MYFSVILVLQKSPISSFYALIGVDLFTYSLKMSSSVLSGHCRSNLRCTLSAKTVNKHIQVESEEQYVLNCYLQDQSTSLSSSLMSQKMMVYPKQVAFYGWLLFFFSFFFFRLNTLYACVRMSN